MSSQRPLVLTLTVGDDARVEARDQDDTLVEHFPDAPGLLRLIDEPRKAIDTRRASDDEHRAVGKALFEFLFGPPVRTLLLGLSERARAAHGGGLQVRLALSQFWQSLPWELLFDETHEEYLATSPDKALYRVVTSPLTPNLPMPSLDIALVASTPRELVPLDTEEEQRRIREVLASGTGSLPRLSVHSDITRGRLDEVLARPVVDRHDDHPGRLVRAARREAHALLDPLGGAQSQERRGEADQGQRYPTANSYSVIATL